MHKKAEALRSKKYMIVTVHTKFPTDTTNFRFYGFKFSLIQQIIQIFFILCR